MTLSAWAALLALLAWLAHGILQQDRNPNSATSLQTKRTADGRQEVELLRNRAGHYLAEGRINGKPVSFLLDTGATLVAVNESTASRLGLFKGMRWPMETANGMVEGWRVLLARVEIGGIEETAVPAVIMPDPAPDEVLLGMSFLKRIEMIQRGNSMTLRTVH